MTAINTTEHNADLIVLASFPKSGNTWARFLIANIYNNLEPTYDEIDFINIHDICPELKGQHLPLSRFTNMPAVYKTHDCYQNVYRKAILILRNPWDALYSYYQYLNHESKIDISLDNVITHETYGIKAIVSHTNSYIRNCDNLLLVTYEGLANSPEKELAKICHFMKIDVSSTIIESAINNSSFDAMRKIEEKKGRKYGDPTFRFTRSGKIGEGVFHIADEKLNRYIVGELARSPLLYLLYV